MSRIVELGTAERAGCSKVLSEDLNEGQRYNSIEIQNPSGYDHREGERVTSGIGGFTRVRKTEEFLKWLKRDPRFKK